MEKLDYEHRDRLKKDVQDFLDFIFGLKDDTVMNIALRMVPSYEDPEQFIRALYWTWMYLTDADALTNSFFHASYLAKPEEDN